MEYLEREHPFIHRRFDPYLNGKWIGEAVSYGCYREGQAPGVKGPSEKEILEDLQIIKDHWNLVRVYGADADSERILRVMRENNLPVRVMLGVWLEDESGQHGKREENLEQVLYGIRLGNEYSDILSAICVGNETLVSWSRHRMEPEDLIRYIRMVRNNTKVPVTTADDYSFWNRPESKKVADELDLIVAHIYAMWNGKSLENAIKWMERIYYHQVKKMHPEKEIVIGETGWATQYDATRTGPGEQGTLIKGEVGIPAQENYLIQLHRWIGKHRVPTFLFEAFDEPWKGGGEHSGPQEIEKHWGVFYENREPKPSFQGYLKHRANHK
jgi:exo-beta-1,3-glucanase (GH17 family)